MATTRVESKPTEADSQNENANKATSSSIAPRQATSNEETIVIGDGLNVTKRKKFLQQRIDINGSISQSRSKKIDMQLVQIIAYEYQPFRIVENKEF